LAEARLFRARGQAPAVVTMVELFFDLVFVFAITQLSHGLLAQLDLRGALQTGLLMVAVWWVWIFTTWVTNWLEPAHSAVRLLLFALMGAGLLMSAALPQAFGARGAVFAGAYVAMQLGRTLFFLWASRGAEAGRARNFQRIGAWLALAGVFWLLGAGLEGDQRLACWALALGLEFIAPALFFWVPGLGRSSLSDWDVDGGHMAERCALFVIIALGESLLISGATLAGLTWSPEVLLAFGAAFVGSVAMWWLYFDKGQHDGHHRIAQPEHAGRHARIGYTYLHLPIVAGIVVCAVADELALAHPDHASPAALAALLGGPLLYLLGVGGFKWSSRGSRLPPLSHLAGITALLGMALAAPALHLSALALLVASAGLLIVVAVWEHLSLRHRAHGS